MDVTVAALQPLRTSFINTTEHWNARLGAIPLFGVVSPYRQYFSDRSRMYVLDTINNELYVNGELKPVVAGITTEKIRILNLLAQAHLAYWITSSRIKRTRRILAVSYAVTLAYSDGLFKDLLYPACEVDMVSDWREIDQQSRALHFRLKFPSNYVGAITDYIVRDHRFIDSGAAFTARTIEPCYCEALRTP